MTTLIPLEEGKALLKSRLFNAETKEGGYVLALSPTVIDELDTIRTIDPIASLEESIYGWVNVRVKGCSPSLCCDGPDFDSEMFKVLDEKLLWLTKVHKEIDAMIEEYKMNGAYSEGTVQFIDIILSDLKIRLSPNQK